MLGWARSPGWNVPSPGIGERAVDVLADRAGSGGEDRRAHGAEVAFGHETDQLDPVHAGRRERRHALEVEGAADDVGEAAVRLVEVGVGRDDGDVLARRAQDEAARVGVGRDRHDGLAHERVVHEQHLAVAPRRVVEGRRRGIEGDQHRPHVGLAIADLQAHGVPRLGELEGGEPVDGVNDRCELHGGSLPSPERAPWGRCAATRRAAAPPRPATASPDDHAVGDIMMSLSDVMISPPRGVSPRGA